MNKKTFRLVLLLVILAVPTYAAEVPALRVGDSTVTIKTYGPNPAQQQLRPKVALVLSGGGARGFAHIPVIEALESAGIPIDMVLGTSMGSLIGGMYAAGYSPGDMRRLIASYDMLDLFAISALPPVRLEPMPLRRSRDNLFVLGFDRGGLGTASGIIGDQRILRMLNDSLSRVAGITDFDKFAMPFRCIGTDLVTGERIVFSSGSLVSAIRASISIPVVFTPYPVEDRLVIDGGLVDNMPIALAKEMGADIVIAVDVNAVDYEVEESELESLTAILAQLVVILTKNTVSDQLQDADLVITPKLTDQGILDFAEVDAILEVGEGAARDRQEDIDALAGKIAAMRPLNPRDPQRYGPYFTLPDVFVRSVSHVSMNAVSNERAPEFDLSRFSAYEGFPLDAVRKQRLGAQFEELRDSGQFATVSYDYTDVSLGKSGGVWGNLQIQTRTFTPKSSTISAGLYGAASYALDGRGDSAIEFKPDFALRYSRYGSWEWSAAVTNDDALHFSGSLMRRFAKYWKGGIELGYITGGIHPTNLRTSFSGSRYRDRMLASELSLQFMEDTRFFVRMSADFDYIWYGDPTVEAEGFIPSAGIEMVYNTMPFGFFPHSGTRFDLSVGSEFIDRTGYRLEGRYQAVLRLGSRDALQVDLHGGSSHIHRPRKDAYFDYGGSRGIPTYSAHTLVDDMILARIKHLHWVAGSSVDLVVQSMVALGWRGETVDRILALDLLDTNPGAPFSSLQTFDASASLALGLSFDTLDILLGCALDANLRFSLYLEVL